MDRPQIRAMLEMVVVFLLGVAPAFFVVFNASFSDGGTDEKLFALLYVVGAYLLLGGIVGILTRGPAWAETIALAGAAVVLLGWYTTKEPGSAAYHLFLLLSALGGAYVGALVGRRFQRPHAFGSERP